MKNLTLSLIFFCSLSVWAQDKIYLKNGENIIVKVLKVSEEKIEYKKYSNLEGPTFEISPEKIQLIVYQNGESQMFNLKNNDLQKEISNFANKNRINLDLLPYGLIGRTIYGPTISYEILNKNGSIGIEIPLSLMFNEGYRGLSGIMTGTNLKLYVSNNARGFYVGPALGVGYYQYGLGAYLGPKLGGQFQISKLLGINLSATGGFISSFIDFNPTIFYSLNFGINFSF